MPVSLTVKLYFEAAHRLHNPGRDDEWNTETYGKCNNVYGHGHNYVIEVTVGGELDPETGYVTDMKILKDVIRERVVQDVDHRHLNHEVPWLEGINPTAENLAVSFAQRLGAGLPEHLKLEAVTVHETERNSATYRP